MNGGGGKRMPAGIPWNGRKDRDEDLLLFRELHKREKDRIASLLQPVSDEFEPSSRNATLYRIASGKKGSGYELFAESGKNEYDWLKTPPATPLFPSLEMEANAPEFVIQREIPVIHPLSRFADNSEASKGASTGRPKSPNPKPKFPLRSVTPGQQRPTISMSSTEAKNSKVLTLSLQNQNTTTQRTSNGVTNTTKSTNQHQKDQFLNSNISKNMIVGADSKTKPKSRGVSPLGRSTIPAQISGFSNETPSNLRTTERSTSATRGQKANPNPAITTTSSRPKPEPNVTKPIRRQSCSPSVARGRKVEPDKQESEGNHCSSHKVTIQTQVLGSRMVQKVMNARKSSGFQERETKPKSQGPTNTNHESNGFGRIMPISSMDMALKHMEVKRDRINSRHLRILSGRNSTTTS